MSQPQLVEAIEDLFVPVLVYNNKSEHANLLKEFDEPAWNNPVIRFFDPERRDLIPRRDGVWATYEIAERMVEALRQAGQTAPEYLRLLAEDLLSDPPPARPIEQATFAMHCYWEGEANLGRVDGVLRTRAVWIDGAEGVDLVFDPSRVSYRELVEKARTLECASTVYVRDDRQWEIASDLNSESIERLAVGVVLPSAKLSDQKYFLQNSPYAKLNLNEMQRLKINAMSSTAEVDTVAIGQLLSPRQRNQH